MPCSYCFSKNYKHAKTCKRPLAPKARKLHPPSMNRAATAGDIAEAIREALDEDHVCKPVEGVTEALAYARFGCKGFVFNVCVTRSVR